MGIESLLSRYTDGQPETSATAGKMMPFQLKALRGAGCMAETSETWQFNKSQTSVSRLDHLVAVSTVLTDGQPGNDYPPANNGTIPDDLAALARRYCVSVYGDSPEQVAEMISELSEVPDDWPAWRYYFSERLGITGDAIRQSEPVVTTAQPVTCGDCSHATATDHAVLVKCSLGVSSGNPAAAYYPTDRHLCHSFTGASR